MQVEVTVEELVRLAAVRGPLPPMVVGVRGDGDAVVVDVDPQRVPNLPGWLRFLAGSAGVVPVVARYVGYEGGTAGFDLAVHARGLPGDRVVSFLADTITAQIARQGLPAGAVRVVRTTAAPQLLVDVPALLEPLVGGLTVEDVAVVGGAVRLRLAVGDVVVRARP